MTRSVKWRLAILAVIACALIGAAIVLWLRNWTYSEAANHYRHYAEGYDSVDDSWRIATCYGQSWDNYVESVAKDIETHKEDRPYRSAQAEYYRKMHRKYRQAASHPWIPISLDPPLTSP